MKKNTVSTLLRMKKNNEKISMITCYDYCTARLIDRSEINGILVGDSLGMVMQGYDTTIPVTMDEMIIYARSVVRGCENTFVVVDMPFMSYQVSVEQAVENAGRLIKETNANAVKLEGGVFVADKIRAIVNSGIPVCAHIGMTPQSVNVFGGFKVQGNGEENAKRILEDALEVQKSGAFMVVLECIPPKLATLIQKKLNIVTIGIGASQNCDGQILVCQDLLGMQESFIPKFVKRFSEIGELMTKGFNDYALEVQKGSFPEEKHCFVKSDCSDEYLEELDKEF